jgi:hypothetical protein
MSSSTSLKEMDLLSPTQGLKSQRKDGTSGKHLVTETDISWIINL